jgi:low temperature requirement protein LtrA
MNTDFLSAMISTLFFLLLVPAVTLIFLHQLTIMRTLNSSVKKLVSILLFLGVVALVLYLKRTFHYETYTYFIYYMLILVGISILLRYKRENNNNK